MASQNFVDARVSRGILRGIHLRTCVEQSFDDGEVIRPGLMDRGPDRTTQHRSAVHVFNFERNFSLDEELYRLQLSAIRGPVKAIHPGAGTCQRIYTILY